MRRAGEPAPKCLEDLELLTERNSLAGPHPHFRTRWVVQRARRRSVPAGILGLVASRPHFSLCLERSVLKPLPVTNLHSSNPPEDTCALQGEPGTLSSSHKPQGEQGTPKDAVACFSAVDRFREFAERVRAKLPDPDPWDSESSFRIAIGSAEKQWRYSTVPRACTAHNKA